MKQRITYCIAILIGLTGFSHLSGQGGFNHTYDNPTGESWMRFEDIVVSDDSLTILGTYGDLGIGRAGVILVRCDTFGNVSRYLSFVDSSGANHLIADATSQLAVTEQGDFLLPILNWSQHTVGFGIVRPDLSLKSYVEYPDDSHTILPRQVVEMNNFYVIFGISQRPNYNILPFASAVDKQGNELWREYYGDSTLRTNFESAIKIAENEIVIGSGSAWQHPPYEDVDVLSQPWIFAIDSTGKMIWEWKGEIMHGGRWVAKNLRRTLDGGWIYTPYKRHLVELFPTVFESEYSPLLVKLNESMQTQWIMDFDIGPRTGYPYLLDCYMDNSGSAFLTGQKGNYYDNIDALVGWVIKVSTLVEQPHIWQVIDTGRWNEGFGFNENFLSGIDVHEAGSVFACGSSDAIGKEEVGWIIKVTSDGCIDTLCTTTALPPIRDTKGSVYVYPNPSSGTISIDATAQNNKGLEFTLYDLYGNAIAHHDLQDPIGNIQLLDSGIMPGTYVYVIREVGSKEIVRSEKIVIIR